MRNSSPRSLRIGLLGIGLMWAVGAILARATGDETPSVAPGDPWTEAEVVRPSDLAHNLADANVTHPRTIQVGFEVLYRGNHIRGSEYLGPGSKPDGLERLKKALASAPRNQEILLYCGCCPMKECPNLRPAFQALKAMGFTRIKALVIPTNLPRDWTEKGYPTEKGSQEPKGS